MGPNRNWNPGDWNIVSHWGGHSNPSSAKFLGFMIVSPQAMGDHRDPSSGARSRVQWGAVFQQPAVDPPTA